MKKLLIAVVMMASAGVCAAQNSALQKATSLMQKEDYQGALELLEAAKANPKTTKLADLYSQLGMAHYAIADTELRKAAQGMAYDTLLYCKNLDQAVENFDKSYAEILNPTTKGKPGSETMNNNKTNMLNICVYFFYAGDFLNRSGRHLESANYFEKFINFPDNPIFAPEERDSLRSRYADVFTQAAYNASFLYYDAKKWDGVLRNADMAARKDVFRRDIYLMKARAYEESGDTAKYAATLLEAANATDETIFITNLANLYMQKNDREAAVKLVDEMIEKDPQNKKAYYNKGYLEMRMVPYNYEVAEQCFQKALAIDSNYVDAMVNMGSCFIYDVQDKLNSNYFKLPTEYGPQADKLYRKIKQEKIYPYYRNAQPYFEKARELAPDKPDVWAKGLHVVYSELLMFDKAKELKEQYPDILSE